MTREDKLRVLAMMLAAEESETRKRMKQPELDIYTRALWYFDKLTTSKYLPQDMIIS